MFLTDLKDTESLDLCHNGEKIGVIKMNRERNKGSVASLIIEVLNTQFTIKKNKAGDTYEHESPRRDAQIH